MFGAIAGCNADAGIRDIGVTGVQTCDLPISIVPASEPNAANALVIEDVVIVPGSFPQTIELLESRGFIVRTIDVSEFQKRSEERRVGKECRSRWSPYH